MTEEAEWKDKNIKFTPSNIFRKESKTIRVILNTAGAPSEFKSPLKFMYTLCKIACIAQHGATGVTTMHIRNQFVCLRDLYAAMCVCYKGQCAMRRFNLT